MIPSLNDVSEKVAAYLADKWQSEVSTTEISQIFGGASRETYVLSLQVNGESRGVVVRRDPPSSLIDTERALEYGAYHAIFPTEIPVPEPLFLEEDVEILGAPFSVMAQIEDSISDVTQLDDTNREIVGNSKWQLLGKLASMDPVSLGFDQFCDVPSLDQCAVQQLDYWANVIDTDQIHPQPVALAAIRWLRANMPAPAQKLSVVHGDYRSGNFLFKGATITGILDWEMCHLGDPLEDLAWSLDPLWSWANPELAGNLLPHDQAIAIWEEASGLKVNLSDFYWWRVFVAVKAVAIWISSSEDFQNGEGKQSILAYAGWVMTDRQNQILLDYLSPLSDKKFGGPRS